ncbi:MAG: TolC family protein [Paludibacteraceae bacterium]|nr:TolC family protein [Paludibacteraceae bacterium]
MSLALASNAMAQRVLSLDSCEVLAIQNNKEQKIAAAELEQAKYEKKAAFGQYFPNISIKGAYFRNEKQISLLSEDAMLPIGSVMADGSFGFALPTMQADGTLSSNQINNKWTMLNGKAVPLDANGVPFNPKTNPEKIQWKEYTTIPKEQMEADVRNMFIAALNLTQPIYMGGKIAAYNKVCNLKKDLAESKQQTQQEDIIEKVDEAYWRIVSLYSKKKAVQGLIDLLEKMTKDVDELIKSGVATKKDALTVSVKKNEAKMTLVKVENGINLSKMQLAMFCGLPLEEDYSLADQNIESIPVEEKLKPNMDEVYQNRSEIKSLELAKSIYDQKVTIERSALLPNVALMTNYIGMNPNFYDGIETKFGWQWNVGVVVNIPLFHFGADYYKLKAAQSEALVQQLKLDETKEKIDLQVTQYTFKQNEAIRKLEVANENLEEANENLRMAQLSFESGIITASNLLEAQTAWLGATSDVIDAEIEAKIFGIHLDRSAGKLGQKN